nr:disulfide bond formation protein DsbD [Vibrio cholerae]
MVTVVVFEFSVMRCQPLRRALCLITKNQLVASFLAPSACWFCVCRQVGFVWRCFLDIYSLTLEIQRIASVDFRVGARLVQLAQSIF